MNYSFLRKHKLARTELNPWLNAIPSSHVIRRMFFQVSPSPLFNKKTWTLLMNFEIFIVFVLKSLPHVPPPPPNTTPELKFSLFLRGFIGKIFIHDFHASLPECIKCPLLIVFPLFYLKILKLIGFTLSSFSYLWYK